MDMALNNMQDVLYMKTALLCLTKVMFCSVKQGKILLIAVR